MKKVITKIRIILFALILLTLAGAAINAYEFTPALENITSSLTVSKSALCGESIVFAPEDFDALFGTEVSAVRITSLPSADSGRLYLGTLETVRNQTVSRSAISSLNFVPADGETVSASFGVALPSGAKGQCCLYLLESVNFSPTASPVSEKTYENVTVWGKASATDPECDRLFYEVCGYPSHGSVCFTSESEGKFRYTPASGYTGRDVFTYRVTDVYGNSSEMCTAKIEIEIPRSAIMYSDMSNSTAARAAIALAENDVYSGKSVGGKSYFSPDEEISRCEFLIMAMKALGVDEAGKVTSLSFADTGAIPDEYKSAVAAAADAGIVNGEDGCFYPARTVSYAEAAVILNNIMKLETPGTLSVFAEEISVPAWAQSSVSAMCSHGVIDAGCDLFSSLNRGAAAEMLYAAMQING